MSRKLACCWLFFCTDYAKLENSSIAGAAGLSLCVLQWCTHTQPCTTLSRTVCTYLPLYAYAYVTQTAAAAAASAANDHEYLHKLRRKRGSHRHKGRADSVKEERDKGLEEKQAYRQRFRKVWNSTHPVCNNIHTQGLNCKKNQLIKLTFYTCAVYCNMQCNLKTC